MQKGDEVVVKGCLCGNPNSEVGDTGVILEVFECGCRLIQLTDSRHILHEEICLELIQS